uniref:Uncharacterized protein n=1 Tax=Anguilla anguilla TaxID=7936 RepID=A0A0E9QQJ1_ANGAN
MLSSQFGKTEQHCNVGSFVLSWVCLCLESRHLKPDSVIPNKPEPTSTTAILKKISSFESKQTPFILVKPSTN